MKETKDIVVCTVDFGFFPHIAQCLGNTVKESLYVNMSRHPLRKLQDDVVGTGLEGVTRIKSIAAAKKKGCDLFVFTDTGLEDEQQELVRDGYAVWGHRGAGVLEEVKGKFLESLYDCCLEVPPYEAVKGFDTLKELLWDKEDLFVKISNWRGDWETFHWRNKTLDAGNLEAYAYRLGPPKEKIVFYVFEKIDTDVEDGVDTWCVDGAFPQMVMHGMERKDHAYLVGMQDIKDCPKYLQQMNECFGKKMAEYGYRGPFSNEARGEYMIDPTLRFGSPPSQIQTELITNLPDVMWYGANGECLEPDFDDDIGAQVLVTTDKGVDEHLTVDIPDELREHFKAAFAYDQDGVLRIAPNPLENWAGWIVATGKSIKDVARTLKDRKALLPSGFECDITSLSDLLRELEEAEKQDITITEEEIPSPAIVLDGEGK